MHEKKLTNACVQISQGRIVPNSNYASLKPAYDFFVGQNCIPQVRPIYGMFPLLSLYWKMMIYACMSLFVSWRSALYAVLHKF
jgi:hypothetical protein